MNPLPSLRLFAALALAMLPVSAQTVVSLQNATATFSQSNFGNFPVGGDVTATWTALSLTSLVSAGGATMTVQGDGSVLVSGTSPNTDTYTFSAITGATSITGFRLEAMLDSSLPFNGPGRQLTNGNFVLHEMTITATAIPEPAGCTALAGAAMLVLALLRRTALAPSRLRT